MGESGLMKCPLGRLCEILLSPLWGSFEAQDVLMCVAGLADEERR